LLSQQGAYFGRDPGVARTSPRSALSIRAVCGTSAKCAAQDDEAGQNVEWCTPYGWEAESFRWAQGSGSPRPGQGEWSPRVFTPGPGANRH
jgi:hypothetical protein